MLVTFVPSRRGRARAGAAATCWASTAARPPPRWRWSTPRPARSSASHYGRTLGDPVAALRVCLTEVVREQVAQALRRGRASDIRAGRHHRLVARAAGRLLRDTRRIYNEIIAHTVGHHLLRPGHRHHLRDRRPGRQVRLPAQPRPGRLRHERGLQRRAPAPSSRSRPPATSTSTAPRRSAPSPCRPRAPLKFGEHCSAFINSDIRKAIQQGASRARHRGRPGPLHRLQLPQPRGRQPAHRRPRSCCRAGVAKNPAMPLAFAQLLGKPVIVPPDPELMGCFGVALHGAAQAGRGRARSRRAARARRAARPVHQSREGVPLPRLRQRLPHPHHEGGRRRATTSAAAATSTRTCAASGGRRSTRCRTASRCGASSTSRPTRRSAEVLPRGGRRRWACPLAFSVHSLWPLYSNFFHALGRAGAAHRRGGRRRAWRAASRSFCFPAEIAHGDDRHAAGAGRRRTSASCRTSRPCRPTRRTCTPASAPSCRGCPTTCAPPSRSTTRGCCGRCSTSPPASRPASRPCWRWPSSWARTREDGRRAFGRWPSSGRPPATARGGGWGARRWPRPSAPAGRSSCSSGGPTTPSPPTANMGIPRKFVTRGWTRHPLRLPAARRRGHPVQHVLVLRAAGPQGRGAGEGPARTSSPATSPTSPARPTPSSSTSSGGSTTPSRS